MDVVAYAGAVRGGIVVAEHMHLFQRAHGHLGDVGHEVIGDAVGVLADQAALVGADGVEVAQQRHVHLGVGLAAVGEHHLVHQLAGAVGVGGAAHTAVLIDGHLLRVAIDGGGGGEHQIVHAVAAHGGQHGEGGGEVVGVVLDGLAHALAHRLVGGELDHRVNVRVLREQLLHLFRVGEVDLHKAEILAGDLLHPAHRLRAGVVVVVGHDDVIAGRQKFHAGMTANVTCAAAH